MASERGRAQTRVVAMPRGGCRTTSWYRNVGQKRLESRAAEGESPVCEDVSGPSGILSSAGHEESCVNRPGPSGKAKYSRETDSVQYREGTVKRTPSRGVKETLKPCAYKRSELR